MIHSETRKTIVLIPAYNAEKTIEAVIARVPQELRLNLLVIDDGSYDCTKTITEELGIDIASHKVNLGYGAAQKTGITYALRQGYENIVILHADGQYPPEKIPDLLVPIKKGSADIVIGSRMLKHSQDNHPHNMPILRILGNRFLTLLENLVLGTSLTGFHCGLRAYSSRCLRSINFNKNSNSFVFDSEILFQAVSKGYSVQEIPIKAYYGQEVSSLKPPSYGYSILTLVIRFLIHKCNIIEIEQFG